MPETPTQYVHTVQVDVRLEVVSPHRLDVPMIEAAAIKLLTEQLAPLRHTQLGAGAAIGDVRVPSSRSVRPDGQAFDSAPLAAAILRALHGYLTRLRSVDTGEAAHPEPRFLSDLLCEAARLLRINLQDMNI